MKSIRKLCLILVCLSLIGCKVFDRIQSPKEREEKDLLGFTKHENPRVSEVQSLLKEKGFDPGAINGRFSPESREAIARFQDFYQLEASGFVDARTLIEINRLSKSDDSSAILTGSDSDLERKPVNQDVTLKPQKPAQNVKKTKSKYTNQTVKIQKALKNAGFDPGPIDGKLGKKTILAITQFQISQSLKADGVLGPKTWEKLKNFF